MVSKDNKREQIEDILKTVKDPELDCDIWTLGLIYEITIKDNNAVHILHTLTSPMCPMGPQIQDDIRSALVQLGYQEIEIELTFDPPWKAPEELRVMLGLP